MSDNPQPPESSDWKPPAAKQTTLDAFPDLLKPYVEALAEEVHNQWARRRHEEGWRYGPERNDRLKETPTMVAYRDLSEEEKAYDRATALATLSFLIDRGLIFGDEPKAGDPRGNSLVEWLNSQNKLNARRVEQIWESRDPETWKQEPQAYRFLARLASGFGAPFLSYDIAAEGYALRREHFSDRTVFSDLGNQQGLSLLETGALDGARQLIQSLKTDGLANADTAGLEGRIYKALGHHEADPEKRRQHFNRSIEAYAGPFERAYRRYREQGEVSAAGEAYYLGINVATLSLFAGEGESSREVAIRVKAVCLETLRADEAEGRESPHWLLATLGEAELLLRELESARRYYRRVVELAGKQVRVLNSMRRQAVQIARHMGMNRTEIEAWFNPPLVLVIHDPGSPRLLEASLKALLVEEPASVVEVYGTLSTQNELAAWSLLHRAGYSLFPTLPLGRKQTLEQFSSGQEQAEIREILHAADRLIGEVTDIGEGERLPLAYFHQYLEGQVALRSESLSARVRRVILGAELASAPASPLISIWHAGDLEVEAVAAAEHPVVDPISAGQPVVARSPWVIRAMLFSDAKGYAELDTAALQIFNEAYLGVIGAVTDAYDDQLLSKRTAGDGLFLVFDRLESAVRLALDLKDGLAKVNWNALGIPGTLATRTSLDAGPVLVYHDPVMHKPEVAGPFVNRAARIEPITPLGEIYVSETFAALVRANRITGVQFEYAGVHILPKGYGSIPLYRMARTSGL